MSSCAEVNHNANLPPETRLVLFTLGFDRDAPIRGDTKLQKILFLVSELFEPLNDILDYEPHFLGPYSEVVQRSTEELKTMGLIKKCGSKYFVTISGETVFKKIKPDPSLRSSLKEFISFFNDMTEDEVLTYVYVFYPKFTEESIKWGTLQKKRKFIANSLYNKEKISLSKAAAIADMPVPDFLLNLRRK